MNYLQLKLVILFLQKNRFLGKFCFYGCWCFPKGPGEAGGFGEPVDDIDKSCREYTTCYNCIHRQGCKNIIIRYVRIFREIYFLLVLRETTSRAICYLWASKNGQKSGHTVYTVYYTPAVPVSTRGLSYRIIAYFNAYRES